MTCACHLGLRRALYRTRLVLRHAGVIRQLSGDVHLCARCMEQWRKAWNNGGYRAWGTVLRYIEFLDHSVVPYSKLHLAPMIRAMLDELGITAMPKYLISTYENMQKNRRYRARKALAAECCIIGKEKYKEIPFRHSRARTYHA